MNSAYVFERNGTVELRDEHRIWVVTPQKAYAETTMYELVVTATESTVYPYKVVVDIIDYNPLTDIERVSMPGYCTNGSPVRFCHRRANAVEQSA